jgi:hypothetical protein
MTETIDTNSGSVQTMSKTGSSGMIEVLKPAELAARLKVPESWVRNRTRARTPKEERIPCARYGRYVRFEWGAPELLEWLERQRKY